MKFIIIAIVVALLAVVFALQNSQTVLVKLCFWEFNSSMALMMLVTLTIGIASGMMTLIPTIYRKNSSIKSNRKKISELEKQLSDLTSKKYS
jgi:uncharacterized integral membrane protein